jgi:hypothetical protein
VFFLRGGKDTREKQMEKEHAEKKENLSKKKRNGRKKICGEKGYLETGVCSDHKKGRQAEKHTKTPKNRQGNRLCPVPHARSAHAVAPLPRISLDMASESEFPQIRNPAHDMTDQDGQETSI